MRNDLYITLEKGEFEKGGKSVARNVEVTVYALDADGQILKVFRLINVFRFPCFLMKYTQSWIQKPKNTLLRENVITLKITSSVLSPSKSEIYCFTLTADKQPIEVEQ